MLNKQIFERMEKKCKEAKKEIDDPNYVPSGRNEKYFRTTRVIRSFGKTGFKIMHHQKKDGHGHS